MSFAARLALLISVASCGPGMQRAPAAVRAPLAPEDPPPPGTVFEPCRPTAARDGDATQMIASHAVPGATLADLAGVRAVGRIGAIETPYGPTFVPSGPYRYVTIPHVFIGDGIVAVVCDRLYSTAGATVNAVMHAPSVTAVVFVFPPGAPRPPTAQAP